MTNVDNPQPGNSGEFKLSPFTQRRLRAADNFIVLFGINSALGIKDKLDREVAQLLVARNWTKMTRKDADYRLHNPIHSIRDTIFGADIGVTANLAINQHIDQQLDKLIEDHMKKYPKDSNRPHFIQYGVNSILSQAESAPIDSWRFIARRSSYRRSAARWREFIQQDRAKQKGN